MDPNQLTTLIVGIIITALLSVITYSAKTTIDQLTKQIDRMSSRLDTIGDHVAEMCPKVEAVWNHFINNKKL